MIVISQKTKKALFRQTVEKVIFKHRNYRESYKNHDSLTCIMSKQQEHTAFLSILKLGDTV